MKKFTIFLFVLILPNLFVLLKKYHRIIFRQKFFSQMQFLTLFLPVYCYSRFSRDMKIHQCDTCQKNFKEKRELRHHVKRVHKGELNFLCEQCSRPFVDAYALKKHVANVHDIDKKFKLRSSSI